MANRVNGATKSQQASSSTIVVTYTPTVGNSMIMVVGYNSGTATVSSITQTNCTWVYSGVRSRDATDGWSTETWYCISVGASPGATATANLSTALPRCSAALEEYDTALAASPVDVSATNSATGGAGTATSETSGTTAATGQASELWIGGFFTVELDADGGVGPTWGSPTNGFAITQSTSASQAGVSGWGTALVDKIVSSTGAASTGVTVSSGYSGYAASMVCFKFVVAAAADRAQQDQFAVVAPSQVNPNLMWFKDLYRRKYGKLVICS